MAAILFLVLALASVSVPFFASDSPGAAQTLEDEIQVAIDNGEIEFPNDRLEGDRQFLYAEALYVVSFKEIYNNSHRGDDVWLLVLGDPGSRVDECFEEGGRDQIELRCLEVFWGRGVEEGETGRWMVTYENGTDHGCLLLNSLNQSQPCPLFGYWVKAGPNEVALLQYGVGAGFLILAVALLASRKHGRDGMIPGGRPQEERSRRRREKPGWVYEEDALWDSYELDDDPFGD